MTAASSRLNGELEAGECRVTGLFQPARPGRDVAVQNDAEELTSSLRVGGQFRYLAVAIGQQGSMTGGLVQQQL